MRNRLVWILTAVLCVPQLLVAAPADLEARRKALNDLLAERWNYTMRTSPEYASILGDKRWNDKLSDGSQKAIDDDLARAKTDLAKFEAVDTASFPDQEVLNKALMVRDLRMQLEGARFKNWEMPVSQNSGPHIDLPQLVSLLSFKSVKDYDDYCSRLRQVPRVFDETIIQMRKGLSEGLMPPKLLLEKVVDQANGLGTQKAEDSPFAGPFAKFPDSVPAADQKRLREAGLAAVREAVLPAYVQFTAFVKNEYAPKGRLDPGIWALPDGVARYDFRVKESTTTNLSAEEIHAIGLAQVKEIEGRMLGVAQQLGFKDLKSFNAAVTADPKLHAHSREQILDLYRKYTAQMYTKLPDLFGRLPKAKVEIMPIEEFNEKDASTTTRLLPTDRVRPT